jgi:hypothetical protein
MIESIPTRAPTTIPKFRPRPAMTGIISDMISNALRKKRIASSFVNELGVKSPEKI